MTKRGGAIIEEDISDTEKVELIKESEVVIEEFNDEKTGKLLLTLIIHFKKDLMKI